MGLQPNDQGSVEHVGNQGTMLEHVLINNYFYYMFIALSLQYILSLSLILSLHIIYIIVLHLVLLLSLIIVDEQAHLRPFGQGHNLNKRDHTIKATLVHNVL